MTVSIEEFRKYLQIDRSSLDDEVMRQASLLFAVSEASIEATAERDALKDNLLQIEAALDKEIRHDFETTKTKFTETQIKSLILMNGSRVQTNDDYLASKTKADKLIALKEAFQARGFMIRDLCSLYSANFFESSSVRATPKMSDRVYDQRRARLAEGRKNRGE